MTHLIRRNDGTFWGGAERWVSDPRAARSFHYEIDAWLACWHECLVPVTEWQAITSHEAEQTAVSA